MRDREILENVKSLINEAAAHSGMDFIGMDLSTQYWPNGCLYLDCGLTVALGGSGDEDGEEGQEFLTLEWLDDDAYCRKIGRIHKSMPRVIAMMAVFAVQEIRISNGRKPAFADAPAY